MRVAGPDARGLTGRAVRSITPSQCARVLTARASAAKAVRVATLYCQSCGTRVPLDEPIPRDSECESCRTDLRCCRNCRHYDPRLNNQCRETQADPVVEKTRRNFCEFFYFSREAYAAGSAGGREADARAKLDSLFGGGSAAPAPGDARKKLEALFGKNAALAPGDARENPQDPPGKGAAADREAEARERLKRMFGEGDPQ